MFKFNWVSGCLCQEPFRDFVVPLESIGKLGASHCGWMGAVRPAAWARWRMPNERAIMIYLEDPWGWGSDSAYGRGVTLRYESL